MFISIPSCGDRIVYSIFNGWENYIHIGVGFEVAYLSELGKFDGLKGEISNEYGSHAFLYICSIGKLKTNILVRGFAGAKR